VKFGDYILEHTVTEVRKDGKVFGVAGRLPKATLESIKTGWFRPGHCFATVKGVVR